MENRMQVILTEEDRGFQRLAEWLAGRGVRKILLVCGDSAFRLPFSSVIQDFPIPYVRFGGFTANPRFEEAESGLALFRAEACDAVLAIGGGSAMDVAKGVKHGVGAEVPLAAVPTTAGTGSESTRFAVLYRNGEKETLESARLLPEAVLLAPSALATLPPYQKKCAFLDALCQGIESWWSLHSTAESREHAACAVRGLVGGMEAYFSGDEAVYGDILRAANRSGRAIDGTRTTAPHAMSYKLTTLYQIPHGHAVALCLPKVWRHMLSREAQCRDPRGRAYLSGVFAQIAGALGCREPEEAIRWLETLLGRLGIRPPKVHGSGDIPLLAGSVNPGRQQNNPVALDEAAFQALYREILEETP